LLRPIQYWAWRDPVRRAHRLLRFAEVEADGGRDLVRAADLTPDPRLRRLYLRHARDERRHADIFQRRGVEILRGLPAAPAPAWEAAWLAPGERGLDDVALERTRDAPLLAFLHLSEQAAARDFAVYSRLLSFDPETRKVFERVLRDEDYHMRYTRQELARVSPKQQTWLIWRGRLSRVWKAYLRFAVWFAGIMGAVILTLQYFLLLPPFALAAKRAERREPQGWSPIAAERNRPAGGQY